MSQQTLSTHSLKWHLIVKLLLVVWCIGIDNTDFGLGPLCQVLAKPQCIALMWNLLPKAV